MGLAYRVALAPGHPDNSFEGSLSYEPGVLSSLEALRRRPRSWSPPTRTRGASTRAFGPTPSRATSSSSPTPGGPPGSTPGPPTARAGRTGAAARRARTRPRRPVSWTALSGFALAALPLPLGDGRHRILASVYAGTGSDLDRFSAFRLSGGSNAGDYETIARPGPPDGRPRRDRLARLRDRQPRGPVAARLLSSSCTSGGRSRPSTGPSATRSGAILQRTDSPNAVTIGLASGFFWSSMIELSWSHNAALESRDRGRIHVRSRRQSTSHLPRRSDNCPPGSQTPRIAPSHVTLHAGDRLGAYEILAPLGSGGTAEVWRARDTRLQAGRRDQGPAGLAGVRPGRPHPVRPRGARRRGPLAPEHPRHPRRRLRGRASLGRHGAPRGPDAQGAAGRGRPALEARRRRSRSRSRKVSKRRTPAGSSTATSSRRTCSSRPTDA